MLPAGHAVLLCNNRHGSDGRRHCNPNLCRPPPCLAALGARRVSRECVAVEDDEELRKLWAQGSVGGNGEEQTEAWTSRQELGSPDPSALSPGIRPRASLALRQTVRKRTPQVTLANQRSVPFSAAPDGVDRVDRVERLRLVFVPAELRGVPAAARRGRGRGRRHGFAMGLPWACHGPVSPRSEPRLVSPLGRCRPSLHAVNQPSSSTVFRLSPSVLVPARTQQHHQGPASTTETLFHAGRTMR